MDLIKIGQFIKEQRKEKNLTQTQLATKLEVSEKTISKWECGNGFPDTSLVLPLCKILDISANELLSGQKLNESEYKTHAEQNIIALQNDNYQKSKFLFTLEWVLGYFCSISFLILVCIASYVNLSLAVRIALIVFGLIQFCVGIHFCLVIEKDVGFYVCPHCKHRHIPTYKQVLFSMHFGRTRYIRCPHCNKLGWQKKTLDNKISEK